MAITFPTAFDRKPTSTVGGDRGLSTKLWQHIQASVGADPRRGVLHLEDFHTLNGTSNYTRTQSGTAGEIALSTAAEAANIGIASIDSEGTTATNGANVQWQGPAVTPANGVKIAFEVRLKADDIATGPQFFAGLSDTDTGIIASSAIASSDYIGFYSVTGDGVLVFATEDGGTQTLSTATVHTLVDGATTTDGTEWVKLGFLVEGTGEVTMFVNGDVVDHGLTAPDLPQGTVLYPSFVCQSGGTVAPIVHIDWFAVGVTDVS